MGREGHVKPRLHSEGRWGLRSFQLAPTQAGHTPTPPSFQDKEKSLSEQRRYSLIDPASAPELLRLQHQLVSTEDALRDALDQAQQVERLVEALRGCSDRTLTISNSGSANGIHQPDKTHKQEDKH